VSSFDLTIGVGPGESAALNDKKAEPELFDAHAGVKLVVPQLEKVGKLRQSSTPKAGMTYWMAFFEPDPRGETRPPSGCRRHRVIPNEHPHC
jgi:hypothetical protein